jgi:hypothetical protein
MGAERCEFIAPGPELKSYRAPKGTPALIGQTLTTSEGFFVAKILNMALTKTHLTFCFLEHPQARSRFCQRPGLRAGLIDKSEPRTEQTFRWKSLRFQKTKCEVRFCVVKSAKFVLNFKLQYAIMKSHFYG